MFLDNRQVAMDSVLEALADSIDYFQDNLERLRPSLRETLKPHYEARAKALQKLRELARRHLKLLPRDADVERDDYMWLWSRLKSFVGNESQVVIGELLEQERVLMQALATLYTHPLPNPLEPVVEQCWKECRALIRELYRLQKERRR
ncbi:hypothetical protein HBJ58_16665 [Halomonas desiderata]|jgi:hypothetical protein|uniref:DUF2383 domain-containing protein n=3 Tax=Billgrantia TaxID=3137761 RepID=A0ABS9ATQ4_9GAMM|nr:MULTISPECIES: hypothetical protein [Halomonas]MCE8001260.1 hypothetical protein [Halomonas ethanolica]MCE8013743.1 hypothetical protein [Halomonas desiderata]MCE8025140.1 hypothetical protein [Halomonas aerodenitrificans]MCE8039645.1 hypothetical protein [Halomonas sp. MCCC 1A11062]MCE8052438.1 hypothetical protein [Halomonas desiderata]